MIKNEMFKKDISLKNADFVWKAGNSSLRKSILYYKVLKFDKAHIFRSLLHVKV